MEDGRFYRWQKDGVWQQILAVLHQQADAAEQFDWSKHYVDSTMIRAHQLADGALASTAVVMAPCEQIRGL